MLKSRRGFFPYGHVALLFNALVLLIWLASAPSSWAAERLRTVLALGDSLTAGYGLAPEDAFPARLEARLAALGAHVRVVNAGVSGDTTAGGLARLDWALADRPDVVIVELGGNDALRGVDPATTEDNLDQILRRLKREGVAVLLAGMRAPFNLGRAYAAEFDAVFPRLARRHDVAFYPFFLDGVVLDPIFNQADRIHPNRLGVDQIVSRIAPRVLALIRSLD